ncbi:MAG: hypothetical protein ACKVVP_04330 [Chloroflexota bacterium]
MADRYPSGGSDRTGAAGINFLTVALVLLVLLAVAWFLFTGPFRMGGTSGSQTNVNVNPPSQQAPNVNINPPQVNVNPPAPANKTE